MIKVIATMEDLQVAEASCHEAGFDQHVRDIHEAFARWNSHEVEHLASDALALLLERDPQAFLFEAMKIVSVLTALTDEAQAADGPATGGGYLGGPHPTVF